MSEPGRDLPAHTDATTRRGAAGALDGVRVLDLTRLLPGPFCTMVLADLGADVIKVESLTGDNARRAEAFIGYNRRKRGIALDLRRARKRSAIVACRRLG